MKILKHGVKKEQMRIYEVGCGNCECRVEVEECELELKNPDDCEYKNPIIGYYICPDCQAHVAVHGEDITRCETKVIEFYKDSSAFDVVKRRSAIIDSVTKEKFCCPVCGETDYEIGNFGDPMFNDIFKIECTNCDYVGPDVGCSDYGEALIMYNDYMKEHNKGVRNK